MLGEAGVRGDREHPGRQRQRRALERGSAKAGSALGTAARGRKGLFRLEQQLGGAWAARGRRSRTAVSGGSHRAGSRGKPGPARSLPRTDRRYCRTARTCPAARDRHSKARRGAARLGSARHLPAPGRGRPAATPSMAPSSFLPFPSFPSARAPLASSWRYLSCGAAIVRSLRRGSGRSSQVCRGARIRRHPRCRDPGPRDSGVGGHSWRC